MNEKTIQCLPKPSQHVPTDLQQFLSYTMLKSKNRYSYHIFVSPGDAPGAITLNVVWMERGFDAYKLFCCMCPSNYNRLWDRAIYWSKIVIFFILPLHSTPPLGGGSSRTSATPFGVEKLEWCGYPMVKNFRRYLYSFWHDPRTWQTDGRTDRQTDRRTDTACRHIPRLCIASRSENYTYACVYACKNFIMIG